MQRYENKFIPPNYSLYFYMTNQKGQSRITNYRLQFQNGMVVEQNDDKSKQMLNEFLYLYIMYYI